MKGKLFVLVILLVVLIPCVIMASGQEEQKSTESAELEIFRWDPGSGRVFYEEAMQDFEEKNPGVKVSLTAVPWSEYVDSLTRFLMADTLPDVFTVYDGNIGSMYGMNALLQLDDYLPDEFRNKFFETHWNNAVIDGKTYGVVFRNQVHAFFWNKDLFRDVGLSQEYIENGPRTYAEVKEAAIACTTDETFGFALGFGDQEGFHMWRNLVQAAGDFIVDMEDYSPRMNKERSVEALEFLLELKDLEVAPPGALGKNSTMLGEEFANGLVAMAQGGMQIGEDYWRSAGEQFELGVAPIIYPNDLDRSMGGGAGFVAHSIAANTKHSELAAELIQNLGSYDFVHGYCKERGLVPTRKDVYENEPYWKTGNQPVYIDSTLAPNFRPLPAHPRVADLMKICMNAIEYAVIGEKSSQQAMDDAAEEWDKMRNE